MRTSVGCGRMNLADEPASLWTGLQQKDAPIFTTLPTLRGIIWSLGLCHFCLMFQTEKSGILGAYFFLMPVWRPKTSKNYCSIVNMFQASQDDTYY